MSACFRAEPFEVSTSVLPPAGVPGVCLGRPSPSAPQIYKQNPALGARRQHNTRHTQSKAQTYLPDQHGRRRHGFQTIPLLKWEDFSVLRVIIP